ncbi:uncharacterized protein EDB93DRAFT_635199 [Suillus bovinus]|uniref:uncharacterized protein n=1 Tax=Suillus bovinus TaxID=48563 RepID=UPI001B87E42C|nr:uncharacterized protein EDB93DRAFT_635199 [Suillus bovinus]KAG2141431.1 hypothetical protein EDB93DRAFT_635199 [Suillus bovinus]
MHPGLPELAPSKIPNQSSNNSINSLFSKIISCCQSAHELDIVRNLLPPEQLLELQLTPEMLDHKALFVSRSSSDFKSSTSVILATLLLTEAWINDQLKLWSGFSRGEL